MGLATTTYERLPVAGQHAAVTAYGAYWWWQRFGPGYKAAVAEYEERDKFTSVGWERWQRRVLKGVLRAAGSNVPHYRDAWTAEEHQAARSGDLSGVPLLEKGPLREAPDRFLDPTRAPRRPLVFATSGSSGTPIRTYWTVEELRRSMGVREARSARWAGVSFASPRATFSGRIVEPDPNSDGPFYRFNAIERQVYLSAFHLRADSAEAYADGLRRHGVIWGTGYATSYAILSSFLVAAGIEPPNMKAVVTTSEKLTESMREEISVGLRCKVVEEYSSVENAFFASECSHGSLHVSPDVGVVEVLRADGSPTDPGEVGEVVVTGLLRTYQPLVRFRIGDLACWSDEPCACGRSMPVLLDVVGRIEDVVTGPDGRKLVRFHGIFIDLPNVFEGQVVQQTSRRFEVRVLAGPAFGEDDRRVIAERMHQRLGSGADIVVTSVDDLERTASGKVKSVIRAEEAPKP